MLHEEIKGWRECVGLGVEVAEMPAQEWVEKCPLDVFIFKAARDRHVIVKMLGRKSMSEAFWEYEIYPDAPSTRGVAQLA